MSLKPTLDLNLSQRLSLTPQLQQAIQFLQMNSIELQQTIEHIMESNPLIEADKTSTGSEQEPVHITQASDKVYQKGNHDWSDQQCADKSLIEQLTWQANCANLSDNELTIAKAIIESLDDDGYLNVSLAEIVNSLSAHNPTDEQQVEQVLKKIHLFEPAGIACRSLKECLTLQLQQIDANTPYLTHALDIVDQHLNLLAKHDYHQILQICKLDQQQFQQVYDLIKSLNPRPGMLIAHSTTQYIVPDVIVEKINNQWQLRLNNDLLPKIRVNQQYAMLLNQSPSEQDNEFIHKNLQQARWLMRSLQKRHETLYKVAHYIVQHQQNFLEQGERAMKPLILNTVAQALDLHDSTISRITTGKYLLTPRGIFELKYFFSSQLKTNHGKICSSTAIRAAIKQLVTDENKKKPLSDQQITKNLATQGYQVARRTVAKYRESLQILPSHQRKNL